jgi:hypothetical protein
MGARTGEQFLDGLRRTGSDRTRVGLTLRRSAPMSNPWLGLLLDGMSMRMAYHTASSSASVSAHDSRGLEGGASYSHRPVARGLPLLPDAWGAALARILPAALAESDAFERVRTARVRLSPEHVSLGTRYQRNDSRAYRYGGIIALPEDEQVVPTRSWRQALDNTARIGLRPLASLHADLTVTSTRDLLAPERATAHGRQRQALESARRGLGGFDLGWESNRALQTNMAFRPPVADWLRPGITYAARFRTDRHPSRIEVMPVGDDTAAVLQRAFQTERQLSRSVVLEPADVTKQT